MEKTLKSTQFCSVLLVARAPGKLSIQQNIHFRSKIPERLRAATVVQPTQFITNSQGQ